MNRRTVVIATVALVAAATAGYWVAQITTAPHAGPPLPPLSALPSPPPSGPPLPGLPVTTAPADAGSPPQSGALTIAADQTGLSWAPAESGSIGPGTQTYTGEAQCTANFVFVDDAHNVYIGQAAHCASTSDSKHVNGCAAASRPLGTEVTFNRAGSPGSAGRIIARGQLAYSSWLSMQSGNESDANACEYNDFALIKVDTADLSKVNPSVPHWGGPVGINTTGVAQGDVVHSYGNSSLRFGAPPLSPQTGTAHAADPALSGWSHSLTSPTPGVPGDSGSAYLDARGNAVGTLSTLGLAIPVVNNIGDLFHELSYAQAHSGIAGLRLVLGIAPFTAK
ncbi:hypothetical protein D2E98_10925 [Mycobacteroides abscessus]|uniref:hypothetical protein n=1 Tax=Mycobacteroides abscessus TaxID=36809 RepID=UPI00078C6A4F|nr:hypothetical protein [Mycobacteroides abscessus]AMU31256.1 hypothetical protein A3N97_12200 [Mycobacteroides abscessus]MBN7321831.1 hypothetical protein [Mycobacteroides abscessus subsp. massiliense]MDO3028732.1 hypothetical protein [Mycobacteroides abscessus subsp. massiliense]PVA86772.1 hypothetical protein DDJ47_19550 [Mycobacteroides abscessus]PVA96268.1 hypothetical protein DDK01_10980 [Mycobacteroides abscessus]